jgi:DinB superfamily
MPFPQTLREHVAALLGWSDAHVGFDDAVAGLPAAARGKVPDGLPYSPWQLVEHIRRTQADILEFCGPDYEEKSWPDDYWPESPEPPSGAAWSASIEQIRRDRGALQKLARDEGRDLTAALPTGKGQTLLRELILAADHTAYHVGELVVVRRLLGQWPTK